MRIAMIEKGKVLNVALFDSMEAAETVFPRYELMDVTDILCSPGWIKNGDGTFSEPEEEEATAEELIDIMLGVGGEANG